jgi:hypothetical protein
MSTIVSCITRKTFPLAKRICNVDIPLRDTQVCIYKWNMEIPPRTKEVVDALAAWCAEDSERRKELIRFISGAAHYSQKEFVTTESAVSRWFANPPRQVPTAEQILMILDFLKRKKSLRTKRKKSPKPLKDG